MQLADVPGKTVALGSSKGRNKALHNWHSQQMASFYASGATRFRSGDEDSMQTAPEQRKRSTSTTRAARVPSNSRERMMESCFREFHTKHVQSAAFEEAERARTQPSMSSQLEEIASIRLSRSVQGPKRRGDTSPAVAVNVEVSGASEQFGFVSGFAKRGNSKKDVIPTRIYSAAKTIFDQGASGGSKRSAEKAYTDLLPQMAACWRSRMLVTPSKIKEWFSSWSTSAKNSKQAANIAEADQAAADEDRSHDVANDIWRKAQQQACIDITREGVAAQAREGSDQRP